MTARSGLRMPFFWNDRSSIRFSFALLGAVQATLIAAITLIVVPLPAIGRAFDVGQSELALVNAGYGLTFSGLLLLSGRVTDRIGARRAFLAGVALFGLASAAGGLAPAYPPLLAARFAQGAGAALTAPAAVALVTGLFPDRAERSRALAVWGTLSVAGATAGTLAGGFLGSWGSWRWAFLPPTVVAAAALLGARPLTRGRDTATDAPGSPDTAGRTRPNRLDLPGGLLVTAGLIVLSYGLLEQVHLPLVGCGVALLAAFAVVEARTADPLLPLPFLARPHRAAALTAVLVTSAASASSIFFLTLWMQQVRGLSELATSIALAPCALVILMGPIAGRLIARKGARPVTGAGLLLGAAAMLLLSRIGPENLPVVPGGFALFAVAGGLAFAGATVTALSGVPAERTGVAGGLVNTVMETGPTLGLAVLVSVATARTDSLRAAGHAPEAATTGGYALALLVTAAILLITALITVTSRAEPTPRSEQPEEPSENLQGPKNATERNPS